MLKKEKSSHLFLAIILLLLSFLKKHSGFFVEISKEEKKCWEENFAFKI
jgi:hypothetical protein